MAVLIKLVDAVLFLSFLTIAIAAPLIDSQTIVPVHLYPTILVDLKSWYTKDFNDYIVAEKPHFLVGLVLLELLFQWPLALLCICGLVSSKSWYSTTCLMYGSSLVTAMVAILAELILSKKASDALLKLYAPFLGIGVLAILRGLLSSHPGKSGAIVRRPALNRKKRA